MIKDITLIQHKNIYP